MVTNNDSFDKHYGLDVVGQSLKHFLLGKGFKIVTSLTVVLILARYLTKEEYAAYISYQGVIMFAGVVASVGVQPVLYRFLPELRASGNNKMMYRLLTYGIVLRLAIVTLLFLITFFAIEKIASFFNLEDWLWIGKCFFLLGIVHLTVMPLAQSLESLLWQKEAQYSMAIGSMLKFVFFLVILSLHELTIQIVVLVEIVAESTMLALMIAGAFNRWRKDSQKSDGSLTWWKYNKGRVFRHGFWGFLVSQTGILYGSGPNRLVAARYLPVSDISVFGAADSIVRMARRIMPTRLLIGFIRPLFVAKYSITEDFKKLVDMSNLIYRINMLILAAPIIVFFVLGEHIFDRVTDGKYADAGPLLGGFLVLMIAESMRALLDFTTQAVEKYKVVLYGNILLSASLFVAIPLFPEMGLWALVVANIIGTILANAITIILLRREGYEFVLDLKPVLLIITYTVVVWLFAWWFYTRTQLLLVTVLLIPLLLAVLLYVKLPFSEEEKDRIGSIGKRIIGRNRKNYAS